MRQLFKVEGLIGLKFLAVITSHIFLTAVSLSVIYLFRSRLCTKWIQMHGEILFDKFVVSVTIVQDQKFLTVFPHFVKCVCIFPEPTEHLFTDASIDSFKLFINFLTISV